MIANHSFFVTPSAVYIHGRYAVRHGCAYNTVPPADLYKPCSGSMRHACVFDTACRSLLYTAAAYTIPCTVLRMRYRLQISTLSTSMGMELEGGRGRDSTQGPGLDFHYPHPYEVEIRAFHYMPAQVRECSWRLCSTLIGRVVLEQFFVWIVLFFVLRV